MTFLTKSKHDVKRTKTKHFVLMQLAHAPSPCCAVPYESSASSTGGETRPTQLPVAETANLCATGRQLRLLR